MNKKYEDCWVMFGLWKLNFQVRIWGSGVFFRISK